VTLTVTDDDGGSTSQTQIVNVTNAAAIVDAGANQSSREGQSVTFNGQFTDPGILDTHTVVWNFGDGTSATRVLAPTHVYSDNGVYSVTLTVTDNNGATTTDSLTVTVNNVAPTITNLSGDLLVDEGTTATFIATATDPGSDTLTYTWNFGDGTTATGANVNHRFGDNGTYTVTLSVVDEDGGSTTKTLSVAVANVAPIVEAGTDQIIYADEPLHLNGRFTDPSLLDTHTITWDFGDGTTASGSLTPNHTYTNSGTYTVKLIVTDKDGAVTQDTFTTTVLRPPSLTISDRTVVEGDDGTVTALFTVTLSEASTRPVTVGYTTADGTAIAGTDYSVTNGSLTFTPGQTSQTIAVQVAGDRLDEFDETFFLNLSGVTNATITDAQGMVTIVDNDEAPLLSISDTTVVEGDASLLNVNLNATILATNGQVVIQEGNNGVVYAVFTVSLSAPSAKPITVAFSTADGTAKAGSDYVAVAGTLSFAPGQMTQTITVPLIGDRIPELTEAFVINLSSPTNAAIADAQGTGTISDNDLSIFAIKAEGKVTINGGGDFDGDPLNLSDDARIYAGKGFTMNGDPTLPVRRDANGNPIRDANGKLMLIDQAVTVATGYTIALPQLNSMQTCCRRKSLKPKPFSYQRMRRLDSKNLTAEFRQELPL
jgi:PKD repeat protein